MSARRTSRSNAAPVVLGMFVAIAAFVGGTLVERSTGASPIEAAVTDREPARTPPVPRIAVYGDSLSCSPSRTSQQSVGRWARG
jgi:hypothetical protein